MTVTSAEFKANFNKYIAMIANKDIIITENGEKIARVVNARKSAVDTLRGLLKNAPRDTSVKTIREERLPDYKVIPEQITSIEQLFGTLPSDVDLGQARTERLSK